MEAIVEVRGLTKIFKDKKIGDKDALKDVSFDIYKGETLGVVGESGSGKSTLAGLITGLKTATSGEIIIRGEKVCGIPKGVQMVFQNPADSFNPRKTIGYSLCEGLLNKGIKKNIAKETVLKLLEECGLSEDIFDKYPHQISGGQCQRAAIVRALALEPDILICDEATSALDVTVQKTIIELLNKIKQSRNLTIIFICHNMSLVKLFCDRYIVLDDGSVKEIVYNE